VAEVLNEVLAEVIFAEEIKTSVETKTSVDSSVHLPDLEALVLRTKSSNLTIKLLYRLLLLNLFKFSLFVIRQ
jgi:hypothetical protein